MGSFSLFKKYENFQFVNSEQLDSIVDYICLNLNSTYTNYGYWYDMYCYATKSRIVIRHRESKNEKGLAKLGECVCKNEVINFLINESKQCNCNDGCASVYFKSVF